MIRKLLFVTVTLALIFSGLSCGPSVEEAVPKPTAPETTSKETTPTPSQETATITGEYIPCPESEGKLQVTHRVLWEFGNTAPMIQLMIKNVSDTRIAATWVDIGQRRNSPYNWFSIKVVSKDGAGNILGETTKGAYNASLSIGLDALKPKEVKTVGVWLFRSDEVKSYEVIMEYHPPYEMPDISGVYIETPEVSQRVALTHHEFVGTYEIGGKPQGKIVVEVKNISSETIGCWWAFDYSVEKGDKCYSDPERPWDQKKSELKMRIGYKDASGSVLQEPWLSEIWIASSHRFRFSVAGSAPEPLNPGEYRTFSIDVPTSILTRPPSYPSVSYEITLYYEESGYGTDR